MIGFVIKFVRAIRLAIPVLIIMLVSGIPVVIMVLTCTAVGMAAVTVGSSGVRSYWNGKEREQSQEQNDIAKFHGERPFCLSINVVLGDFFDKVIETVKEIFDDLASKVCLVFGDRLSFKILENGVNRIFGGKLVLLVT